MTTDLQDYHFHRCYTCANFDFKATTKKQHKGEQFHKSSNSSANNGKMAMYLITSLESSLGGLSRKQIVHIDFTFNQSYSAIVLPLIHKLTTFTDVILCAKIGFKATTGKRHKLD